MILVNICIPIVCQQGCDVINFEINRIFLIKSFLYIKNQDKNLNILKTRRAFKVKQKAFSIIFKGLSVAINYHRPESAPLIIDVVFIVARLVFVFCCALTTGRCNVFKNIFGNQKKSEFCSPNFQTMLFLVTMIRCFKNEPGLQIFFSLYDGKMYPVHKRDESGSEIAFYYILRFKRLYNN